MKFSTKKNDYGWLVVLFFILLIAMIYSILFGKSEGFTSMKDIDSGLKLVFFYNDECSYCKEMMPVWDKVSSMAANSTKMVKIDSTANKDIADNYKITSYPTILLLKSGKREEEYTGERTESALSSYVKKKLFPKPT
jgi:thioredoxin 1